MPRRPHPPLLPAALGTLLWTGVYPASTAQETPRLPIPGLSQEEDFKKPSLPGLEMLIDGSILTKVLFPQYGPDQHLKSSLRADEIIMLSRDSFDATTVRIQFYHPDESQRAQIDLASAHLDNKGERGILRSKETVTLQAQDFDATGTGLVYEIRASRGLLLGPALAHFNSTRLTAMNTRPLTAAGSLMLVSTAFAATPPKLDADQIRGLDRLAVSLAPAAQAAAAQGRETLAQAEKISREADENLDAFLKNTASKLPPGPTPDLETAVPDPQVASTVEQATIRAKDGIYFDSEAGILTFLKDIDFNHPRFSLQGADQVKVFFEKLAKTPENPAAKGKKDKKEDGDFKFGDPTRIVATGTLVVERKKTPDNSRAVKASGREMVYDLKSDELIIRGGQPWILSDTASGRVVDPKGYIRINLNTGNASFVGASKAFVETKDAKH